MVAVLATAPCSSCGGGTVRIYRPVQPPVVVPGPVCAVRDLTRIGEEGYFPDVCKKIVLSSDVFFNVGSSALRPGAHNHVQSFARRLREKPDAVFYVDGYTDSQGGEEYNFRLSLRRAQAVRDILVEIGIAPERLIVRGFGEELPVASNATARGRQLNRRVELVEKTE